MNARLASLPVFWALFTLVAAMSLTSNVGAQPATIPAPLDVAAPPIAAKRTASGLAYRVLKPGKGESPTADELVVVHYTGWTVDGKMFDSSVTRGRPASFRGTQVIKGWTEGLQLMHVGEKSRFWIPAELAYGNRPGRPQGMLVFDIELLEIKPQDAPVTPRSLRSPPPEAARRASGLAYVILAPKHGASPTPSDRVEVHYSGWTTDGELFDSSLSRGRSATFPVTAVIKGWQEMLQLMRVGEKARAWIPADLAYGNTPGRGRPAGDLIFDIELIRIVR